MWITLIKINQKKLVRTEKNVYLCRVANELQEFFEISVSNYKWVYPYEDRYARTLNQQKKPNSYVRNFRHGYKYPNKLL